MSFQILDIVLYGGESERRILSLKPGRVNIITGGPQTGKTALIDIVDYCLCSKECMIPGGPVFKSVKWVALRAC